MTKSEIAFKIITGHHPQVQQAEKHNKNYYKHTSSTELIIHIRPNITIVEKACACSP